MTKHQRASLSPVSANVAVAYSEEAEAGTSSEDLRLIPTMSIMKNQGCAAAIDIKTNMKVVVVPSEARAAVEVREADTKATLGKRPTTTRRHIESSHQMRS